MSSGLRSFLRYLTRLNRQQRRARHQPERYRPGMEALEDRSLPATHFFTVQSATAAGLNAVIDQFKANLGGPEITSLNAVAASSGYRDLTFDDVPTGSLNPFPGDYYSQQSSRGLLLTTPNPGSSLQVSLDGPASQQRFGNIDPSYSALFQSYSGNRLITPIGTRTTNVTFTDPQNPGNDATVKGFGVIFSDVDIFGSTTFQAFGPGNVDLTGVVTVQPLNNGFSFVGVVFTEGERIAKVTLTTGNTSLAPLQTETGGVDLVVMDDMIFSQPQASTKRVYLWNDVGADNAWNNPANWTLTSGTPASPAANRYPHGAGEIAVFGANLQSDKTIVVADPSTAVGSMQFDTSHTVTFNAPGNGSFSFVDNGNNSPSAALDMTDNDGDATAVFNLPVQFTNTWQITTLGSTKAQFTAPVTSAAGITQRGSGTLDFAHTSPVTTDSFTGPLTMQGGTVNVDATFTNSAVALNNATITGSGEVDGMSVQGTVLVSPGSAGTPGVLTSDQNVVWNNTTTFLVKLRGTNPAQYDQLVVSDDVNLNGAILQLDLTGFNPVLSNSFVILSTTGGGNTISGASKFAQGSSIVADGKLFKIDYTSTQVTLTYVSPDTSVTLTKTPNTSTTFGQSVKLDASVVTSVGTPTGSIRFDFNIGAVTQSFVTVPLTGNLASTTLTTLNTGNYTIVATYVPDLGSVYNTSFNQVNHQVNPSLVSINVTTSQSPAVFTTPTIKARVLGTGTGSIPTGGMVTFVDANNTVLGSAPIDATGFATLPASPPLNTGNYSIRASFSSTDSNFTDGDTTRSNTLSQTITRASTTTTLSSNPATWNFDQNILFTATVTTPATSTPTGQVQFILVGVPDGMGHNDTQLGASSLVGNQATLTTKLPGGSQTVRAVYVPDNPPNNFLGSSGQLTQVVNAIPVNIALLPLSTTIVHGQLFSFQATISPVSPTAPVPVTGNVVFTLNAGGAPIVSSPVALLNGVAFLTDATVSTVPVGVYSISVHYLGNNQYLNNTTNYADALTVNRADVTVGLDPANGICGQLISTTSTVSVNAPGAGVPGGVIHFTLTGPITTTQDVPVQNVGGVFQATLNRNDLPAGTYSATAQYVDSMGQLNTGISGPVAIIVSTADAVLTLNPNLTSNYADTLIFTANVASFLLPSGVPVAGNVHFEIISVANGTVVGQGDPTVMNGVASFTAPPLLHVGQYQVTAAYLGDGNYNPTGLKSILHTISAAVTSTSVIVQPIPGSTTVYGQQVTFRALVQPSNAAAGIPTGTVIFRLVMPDGSPDIVSQPIALNAQGTADFSPTTVLPPTEGRQPLQVIASYQGNDIQNRFAPSSNINSPLLQTVLRANTAIAFTMTRVSDNATTGFRYSDAVSLMAKVTVDHSR